MTDSPSKSIPLAALIFGVAGFIPQALALLISLNGPHRALGLTIGYFYAALILSFLGGIWWGVAAARPEAPRWLYGVAVVPSLCAFATALFWIVGQGSWTPMLTVLGGLLMVSVAVDWWLAQKGLIAVGMLRLRVILSGGLGILTLALAFA